jgi:hypothetical protein
MKDENRNGLPDDTWYELAGSEYFFDSTIKSYSVTYKNPGGEAAADVPWSDNQGNTGMVPANTVHSQRYYPLHDSFPGVSPDSYSLPGTRIEADVDFSQPGFVRSYPKTFGYADNHPRGDAPYTLPDNPYTPALENSGGDAFDISWAVDAMGEYVELEEIHFVKVHTAVLATIGWLGEISTEISGAVDVLPDKSISGETRSVVLKNLPDTLVGSRFKLEAHAFLMGRKQENEKIRWSVDKGDAEIDPENRLSFSVSGKVKITAALENEPSVSDSDSAVLVYKDPSALSPEGIPEPHVYPNPASDQLFLEYGRVAPVSIHSVSGQPVSMFKTVPGRNTVDISGLEKGVYILRISADPSPVILRFIKN